MREDGTTQVSWTASGVEIRFSGTGVTAQLDRQSILNGPRVQAYVDGRPHGERIAVKRGGIFTLAKDLAAGGHTLKLVKITEAQETCLLVDGVCVIGGSLLAPPPAKERKIEFIGDSITCGHTNERGEDDPDVWDIDIENGMLTYAAVCAEKLDADFNVFARSGWTIYRRTDTEDGDRCAIPPIYDQIAPLNGNTDAWDFSEFPADVVVLALGTNDSSFIGRGPEEAEIFVRKYEEFLRHLRGCYPNASIVCTIGMLTDQPYPYICRAVEAVHDSNIFTFREPWKRSSHPLVSDHRETGEALAAFIAKIRGWN